MSQPTPTTRYNLLHATKYGVHVLQICQSWIFDSKTGECLGLLRQRGQFSFQVSVWTEGGLVDLDVVSHSTAHAIYAMRHHLAEMRDRQAKEAKATKEENE